MTERADCLVVGGGPAGSSAAWALVQAGLSVVVLDKAAFPRDKVCAGWVTPQTFAARAIEPAEYAAQGHVLQPIRGFRSGLYGEPLAPLDYPEVVSYGVLRREFDAYLLRRSGARVVTEAPVQAIARRHGCWRVETAKGAFAAPWLIGAGGHFCPVARHLGARPGRGEPTVLAREVEVRLGPDQVRACPLPGEVPRLEFFPELDGYAWVFRKGDWLNIGLGREDGHHIAAQLDAYLARLRREGVVPADLPCRPRGHAYLLYGHARRRGFAEGLLLAGDALGLAYPQSGEGIRPAVESGLIAARLVLEDPADTRAARLAEYPSRLAARFGAGAAPAWLPAPLRRGLGRWVLRRAELQRRLVIERGFLHRHQPPLVHAR